MSIQARAAAEHAARASYGRLVAAIAARCGDLAAAEDALADAFAAALKDWPEKGAPRDPDAWLYAVARRKLTDGARRAKVRADAEPALTQLAEEREASGDEPFPDERLKLLFVCAHPAIDPAVRTPLMLQTVLGLDAARIASAFLVKPATMGQRLSRAKSKIKAAGIPFETPSLEEAPSRLTDVLEAIYAAYGTGWADAPGGDVKAVGLTREAVWLARLVTTLVPDAGEAGGLLALMLHCEARVNARRDGKGGFVPLGEQDTRAWDFRMIAEAEAVLRRALTQGSHDRFQLEAAIQSAHAARSWRGRTDWPAIAALYDRLISVAPTIGAYVGRAAALGEAEGVAAGLAALDGLSDRASSYQPYWAVRAHLLAASGDASAARAAYDRAIGLSDEPAVRAFLRGRAEAL